MQDTTAQLYTLINDVQALVADITPDSIISRTFYKDGALRAIVFGFAAGQELSEHTSAHTAIVHFLSGQALVTVDGDQHEAGPGTWLHMTPRLKHSVAAKTPVVMLLLMVEQA